MNADVAMCPAWIACSREANCLRRTAVPHPTRQLWSPPLAVDEACRDFIPNARTLPPAKPGEDYGPGANARWFEEAEDCNASDASAS